MKKIVKRCICFLPVFVFIVMVNSIDVKAANVSWEGYGTPDRPYLISSAEDWNDLAQQVLDGNNFDDISFKQTCDISFLETSFMPIGSVMENKSFNGYYNGDGHEITDIIQLKDVYNYDTYACLFEYFSGVIYNLKLSDSAFIAHNAAGFVGRTSQSDSLIINCYNYALVYGENSAGIAVNFEDGTISNCMYMPYDNRYKVSRGILAENSDTRIYACLTDQGEISQTQENRASHAFAQLKKSKKTDFILNVKLSLAQYLFASKYDVDLLNISIDDAGGVIFQYGENIIGYVMYVINYIMPIIFACIAMIYLLIKARDKSESSLIAVSILALSLTLLVDTALYRNPDFLNKWNIIFSLLMKIIFFYSVYIQRKRIHNYLCLLKRKGAEYVFFLPLIIICVVMTLQYLYSMPRYDANIYYGSFIRGTNLFRVDFITFVGAFVCWKSVHGVALLLAPFEYVFKGDYFGVAVLGLLLMIMSMLALNALQKKWIPNIGVIGRALVCSCFIFMPYSIGLAEYFSLDWYLPHLAVLLFWAYENKDHKLIALIGCIMAYTKVTGFVFYVIFLSCCALIEIYREEAFLFKRLKEWFEWKKVVLWLLPAFLYLPMFLWEDFVTIQNFYGHYEGGSIKSQIAYLNTILQSFVWGFRWLLVLAFVIILLCHINKLRIKDFFKKNGNIGVISGLMACLGVVAILLVYKSDAECPRYTSILNAGYIIIMCLIVDYVASSKIRMTLEIGFTVAFIAQTFWTVDPSIILLTQPIYTGTTNIYRICLKGDIRQGINIGYGYGVGDSLGDLTTYNMQYNYYDDLIQKTFRHFSPENDLNYYILDVMDYETNLDGSRQRDYLIYWDVEKKKRVMEDYQGTVEIREKGLLTQDISTSDLEDDFYMVCAGRVDEKNAITILEDKGYSIVDEYESKDIYGTMITYEFKRSE